MRGRDQVVRSLWRDLLPTAFLLTGDQAAAQHLLVRALAPGRRAVTDHDTAVLALVRTHRRRWPATGTGRITGELPTPWWAAPADVAAAHDLSSHLDALDRDHRAATVLHWFEDWDVARTTALLPHVDLDALARRLPTGLPRRLEVLAGLCDTTALDDDTVVGAVRATSARRTRRTALAVTGIAALVAAGTWWPDQAAPQPTAAPDRDRPASTRVQPQGVLAAAPRGPLAGDDEVMDAVRARLADQGESADDLRPLCGDDVQGVRVLLVAGSDGTQYWLTGPAGASPAVLDVSGVGSGPDDETAMAVAVDGPDGRVRLVVVTEEGTGLAVRPGVDVDPTTGVPSSTWLDLPTTDGIAAITLDRTWSSGIGLTADRPDGPAVPIWALPAGGTYWTQDTGPGVASRSSNTTASAYAHAAALDTISHATGWAREDLQVSVLGAVDVPAPSGSTVEVVGLAAVLPNGAVVTSTGSGYLQVTDDSTTSSWNDCGASSYPASTDPADLVVAATCLASGPDDTGFDRITVVLAPPGTDVELRTVDGAPVPVDLQAGAGWSTYAGPSDLATATADGATYPVAGPTSNAFAS